MALLGALPALAALAVFGILHTPDTPGYLTYAEQIRTGTVPNGAALLASGPSPVSLFRAPGYSLVLAALQRVFPGAWQMAVVLLQIAAQAAVTGAAYRAARALGAGRERATVAALLPAIGFGVVVQIALLTDGLYAALATGAALLLTRGRPGAAALAGLALGCATLLREATPFLMIGYLPLALLVTDGRGRRLLCGALVLAGPAVAAGGLMAWNAARIGRPVLTTSRQTVMVQAVLPLLKKHLPVYDGDDRFDRIARETVGSGEYSAIDTLHDRLFREAGMSAPEIADAATRRYVAAWRRFPGAMLMASLQNFRHEFLAMPFQPVDTVGALMVYAGWPRPVFDRLNLLWSALRHGSAVAGLEIAADVLTRLLGTAISLLAIATPLLLRGQSDRAARTRFGLWLVCCAFPAVYLPVHIEPRYLAPVVPLVCVLAACALPPGNRLASAGVQQRIMHSRSGTMA